MRTPRTAPRPWVHDDQGPTVSLVDNAGDPIGRIFDEDDAALIVAAVNAHDALVESLEEAWRVLRHGYAVNDTLVEQISEALAMAKGEAK